MSLRNSIFMIACIGFFFCSSLARAQPIVPQPNLTIDRVLLSTSVVFESRNFRKNDCAVVDGCVGSIGVRKLMRFSVSTPNSGDADLILGDPKLRPDLFTYSRCHKHYHFNGYASYELLDR